MNFKSFRKISDFIRTSSSPGFNKIGWYSGLRAKYPNAMADEVLSGNTTCGIPRHDSFQLLRHPIDSDLPWPGFLFGQSTASIWYWCADQVRENAFYLLVDMADITLIEILGTVYCGAAR